MSVTLLQIASFLLPRPRYIGGRGIVFDRFLCIFSRWNRAIFWPSFLHVPLYKTTGDVWVYQGVFGDGRFNGTMQNVVGQTLVATATKFGLGAEIQSPTDGYF